MKKNFLKWFLLAIMSLLIVTNYENRAECPSLGCDSAWKPGIQPVFAGLGACQFLVYISYRQCNDGTYEMRIDKLSFINNNTCPGVSYSDIMNTAVKQALYESGWMLNINGWANGWSVRLRNYACWRSVQAGLDGNITLEPCPEDCCIWVYHLDAFGDDANVVLISATPIYNQSPAFSCPPTCVNLCSANSIPPGTPIVQAPNYCIGSDCPNVRWSNVPKILTIDKFTFQYSTNPPLPKEITNIEVSYRTRYCPDIDRWEFYIDMIYAPKLDSCPTEYSNIQDFFKLVFKKVMKELTKDPNFPPLNAVVNFRRAACWQCQTYYYDNDHYGKVIYPCAFNNCCKVEYSLQYNMQTNLWEVLSETDYPQDWSCEGNGPWCYYYICNDNFKIISQGQQPVPLTRIASNEPNNSTDNSEFKSMTYSEPNPADNTIKIHYISQSKGNVRIRIFDLLGNSVFETKFVKSKTEEITEIDLTKFNEGVFNYRIEDEENSITGKFIIKK
jgi:hypothetical protein